MLPTFSSSVVLQMQRQRQNPLSLLDLMRKKEMSSLSVEESEGSITFVSLFEIKQSELAAFYEREDEFRKDTLFTTATSYRLKNRFVEVEPQTVDGVSIGRKAIMCARYNDEDYFRERLHSNRDEYWTRWGR